MKNQYIVGVVAKRRRGKDTVADYLTRSYEYQRYGFADPLKEGVGKMFDLSWEQLYGDLKEVIDPRWGVTPRQLLQKIGTELFQFELPKLLPGMAHIGRKIWVHRFKIWKQANPDARIVFSDVRFPHEADEIRAMGGVVLKIERPSMDVELAEDLHASEMELDLIVPDHIILNDGTLEQLYSKIDFVLPE